jgi:hypothetical protein
VGSAFDNWASPLIDLPNGLCLRLSGRVTLGPYRNCREAKLRSDSIAGGSVSIGRFQVSRLRLRRMRFSMGFQSDFYCPTASRLRGNGLGERSSESR